MAAASQSNIMSAFEAIIKCKDATITEKHHLERDPSTGEKIGQSDIWFFSLPASKIKLVKNVTAAFNRDKDKAYAITSGTSMNSENFSLAVGNGENGQSVEVTSPGHEYIYSLFLAPQSEDASGIHRYAYAMNYIQADGKITGKLVVTYATTLKYRQGQTRNEQIRIIQGWSGDNFTPIQSGTQQSWLTTLMSYLQNMRYVSNKTRISLATKAYDHIQATSKDSSVTELDKNTAREIIKGMISNKEYSDPMVKQMLNACLVGLK